MPTQSRRTFLERTAALSCAAAFASRATTIRAAGTPKKAVLITMLPKGPYLDRFTAARDAGFVGVEMQTMADQAEAEQAREAASARASRSTR